MRLVDFGETVRKYRKDHDMTQEELAGILNIQPKYLSYLENGHRSPGVNVQKKMEELLMADELNSAICKEEKMLTDEEMEIQIRFYQKLRKIHPLRRKEALDTVYRILDMMARVK